MPTTASNKLVTSDLIKGRGGLVVNENILRDNKGESLDLVNFEVGLNGGYRRLSGFTTYSSTEVSGTGVVLGVKLFNSGVVVARLNTVYFGTGTTWSSIGTRTSGGVYDFDDYNWTGTAKIVMADGVNQAAIYDATTYTLLNGTNAPTNPSICAAHADHLFFSGESANTGLVTFTQPFSDTAFDPAQGAGTIQVGDTIVDMVSWRDRLIILCKNSIHQLLGTSVADFQLKKITDNIGCLAKGSVQEIGGDVIFLAPDGIRTVAGTDKLDDIELGSISRNIQPLINKIFNTSTLNSAEISSVVIREKSQYRLFYPVSNDLESVSKGILGAIRRTPEGGIAWEWSETLGIKPRVCDSDYIGDDETVIHGGYDDGFVYQQESGNSFNGSSVQATYRTPDYDFGDITIRKTLHTVRVFYRVEGTVSISLNVFYDYGDNDVSQPSAYTLVNSGAAAIYGSTFIYGSSIYGATFEPTTKQNVEGSGFTAALNFSTNDTNPPYSIEGFVIEFVPFYRR
jgi:hypothetical protein|tara:strand:- start:41 stop:1573 length:1533 start_codon:yes stop_codon:yes gene_type:complete